MLRVARRAGRKIHALLLLLYDACLRAGEVAKVALAHCKYLHRGQFYTPRSKGGRSGWVKLNRVTVTALMLWIDEKYPDRAARRAELPVFTTRRKYGHGEHAMSRHSVYRIIEALGETAQIPRAIAHPHAVRHGFIMHFLAYARAAGLTYEQMIPPLAARVGHRTAQTLINNYLSETAGAEKVMRQLTAQMLRDDEEDDTETQ